MVFVLSEQLLVTQRAVFMAGKGRGARTRCRVETVKDICHGAHRNQIGLGPVRTREVSHVKELVET